MNTGGDQLIYYLTFGAPVILAIIVIMLAVVVIKLRNKINHLTQLHETQEATLLNDAITIEDPVLHFPGTHYQYHETCITCNDFYHFGFERE